MTHRLFAELLELNQTSLHATREKNARGLGQSSGLGLRAEVIANGKSGLN
jgi:hypothetical protein